MRDCHKKLRLDNFFIISIGSDYTVFTGDCLSWCYMSSGNHFTPDELSARTHIYAITNDNVIHIIMFLDEFLLIDACSESHQRTTQFHLDLEI